MTAARAWMFAAALTALLGACGEEAGPQPDPYPLDGVLRLHHVQVKGTHNSYHVEPERVVDASHAYSHAPLDVQLEEQGVRQFELDVHFSVEGHFEVLHLPGIDAQTTCQRLIACLEIIVAWSDAHPGHMPVVVWVEPKDDVERLVDNPDVLGYDVLDGHFDQLDAEIRAAIPASKRFEPDDLRGDFDALPEAIAAEGGWPTLGRVRGRIIFAMLDDGEHLAAYKEGRPALQGRAMFANASSPQDPHAAMFKINDAVGGRDRVQSLLRAGFLVTSNIDGAGEGVEEAEASLQGSLEAGANFLSSDFPAPVEGFDYVAEVPGGAPARCNPVTAPPECTPEAIEALRAPADPPRR